MYFLLDKLLFHYDYNIYNEYLQYVETIIKLKKNF